MDESTFMSNMVGAVAVWTFSSLFIIGLFVLYPMSICLQRRAGVTIPGPVVPSWLGWLCLIVLFALLALLLAGAAVHFLWSD